MVVVDERLDEPLRWLPRGWRSAMRNVFDHESGESLDVGGAKIYFEICGNQEGPPLLMLHGGFGTIEDFNVFLPSLSADFKIIGIDSRSHGRSTLGSKELTYELLQQDVLRVLEHLGLPSVSIIGFSDGGIVGYRLAALTSLKVEKLVTIGAAWRLLEDDPVKEIFSRVTPESWRKKFPETVETYQRLNPEPDFDTFARSSVRMWLDSSASGYPGDAIESISCPLLIVRGDDDHLVSLADIAELRERVEGSKLLNIPFAGHVAYKDQREIFLSSFKQFFGAPSE